MVPNGTRHGTRSAPRWKRVGKLALGGVLATLVDLLVLILLVERGGLPAGLAAFLSATAGAGIGFTVSKYWAFADSSPLRIGELLRFACVALVSASSVGLLVHWLASSLPYLLAKALAAALVFFLWSYPAQSRVVFTRAPQGAH